ncbi:MAG: hypothetical protein QOI98_2153 [Solirubrobacteraceae bacterium]|jgi:hypothetical protein|nr:hypothetical protein [Solirubrobacteraceae bacterium]
MESVEATPTEPVDYAAISAGYAALLGTLVLAAREREGDIALEPAEIVPLGAATFALSKLVAREKIESWMREPFVEEGADGTRRPKGRRLRYAIGELLTCTRCVGAWSALGLVSLRVFRPREARVVTTVLGVSAANDFLHAGFSWLCGHANTFQTETRSAVAPHTDGNGSEREPLQRSQTSG